MNFKNSPGNKGKVAFLAVIAVVVLMAASIIPMISVDGDGPEDSIITVQSPYSNLSYWDDAGTVQYGITEKHYYTEVVDLKFNEIINGVTNKIFVGWSRTPGSTTAEFKILPSTTASPLQGTRTLTMGGEDVKLYAVWLTGTINTVSTGNQTPNIGTSAGIIVNNGTTSVTVSGTAAAGGFYILLNSTTSLSQINVSGVTGSVIIQYNGNNSISKTTNDAAIKTSNSVNTIIEGRVGANLALTRNADVNATNAVFGGDNGNHSGTIQIESGNLTVTNNTSQMFAATLGGGQNGNGNIVINGGTVTVSSTTSFNGMTGSAWLTYDYGQNGAGIGGGGIRGSSANGVGNVTITDGVVVANLTSKNRVLLGAGIGGGGNSDSSNTNRGAAGNVKIMGGKVNASLTCQDTSLNGNTQAKGAGIGGGGGYQGSNSNGWGGLGTVNISGGTVTTNFSNMRNTTEIGSGNNGNASVVTITGGSILTSNLPTSYTRYVLNASTASTGGGIKSVLVKVGTAQYVNYNISYFHNGTTSLYIYLPSGTNLVSLEYGDGKVSYYGDTTIGAPALGTANTNPSGNTYYRVQSYLDGLMTGAALPVHALSGSTLAYTLSVTNGNTMPPVVFVDEGNSTLYPIKDGDTVNKTYNRTTGAVSFSNVAGKHVLVANSITGYNVEYEETIANSVTFGPSNPNKIFVTSLVPIGQDQLSFDIAPKANYIITNVDWEDRLGNSGSLATQGVYGEGTYVMNGIQSSITITVTAIQAYEVIPNIIFTTSNPSPVNVPSYVGPQWVPYNEGFEFSVTSGGYFNIVEVTWEYGAGTSGTFADSEDREYEFDDADVTNANLSVTICLEEYRWITFTVAPSALISYTVDGGTPIVLTPAGAVAYDKDYVHPYGSVIEVTIDQDLGTGSALTGIEIIRLGGIEEESWAPPTSLPFTHTLNNTGGLDTVYMVITEAVPSWIISYDDGPVEDCVAYEDGLGYVVPNTVPKADATLTFTIFKVDGFRLSKATYYIGSSPVTDITGMITIDVNGNYVFNIPTSGFAGWGSNIVNIYLTTVQSWNVEYVPNADVAFAVTPPTVIDVGTPLQFSAKSVKTGSGQYRMYEVKWNIKGQTGATVIPGTPGTGYTDYSLNSIQTWSPTAVIEITVSVVEFFNITTNVYLDGVLKSSGDYTTLFSQFNEPKTTANKDERLVFSTTAKSPYRISDVQFKSGTSGSTPMTPLTGEKTTDPIIANSTISIYLVTTHTITYEGDANNTSIVSFYDTDINATKKPATTDTKTDVNFTANPLTGYIISVEYKIGSGGSYAPLSPATGGKYTILAAEVVDTVYIRITSQEVYYLTVNTSNAFDVFTINGITGTDGVSVPIVKDQTVTLVQMGIGSNRVFLGWENTNGDGSDSATYVFTMTSDMTVLLVSEDEANVVKLTLVADPGVGGSFTYTVYGTVPQTYTGPILAKINTPIIITANGVGSYDFLRWTDGVGDSMSKVRTFEYATGGDKTETARFATDVVVLILGTTPSEAYEEGLVTFTYEIGSGGVLPYINGIRLASGETVRIFLTENGDPTTEGFIFMSWNDGLATKNRTYTWNSADVGEKKFAAIYAELVNISNATVSINKDDAAWTDFVGTVYLKQSGTVKYYSNASGGIFTFNIVAGIYDVYVGDDKVGVIDTSSLTPIVLNYYTATVNILKDGSIWTDYDGTEPKLNGTLTGTLNNGVYSFGILLEGTYDVYVGTVKTGTLTIVSSKLTSDVEYLTVTFTITLDNATGTTIAATADGVTITSGTPVLKGADVVITITPSGAIGTGATYTYEWTPAAGNINELEFDDLAALVNVTCKVTGIDGTFGAVVTINVDGSASDHFGTNVELRQGATTFPYALKGTGVYTFNVLVGNYDIYVDNVKVGELVQTASGVSATVEYFTVEFEVSWNEAATGASIASNTGVVSGDIVLKNTTFILTATGVGAVGTGAGYTYLWSDNTTTQTLNVTVTGTFSASCIVTGVNGTFTGTVTVYKDVPIWTGYDGVITLEGVTGGSYAAGVFTFIAYADTYKILIDGVDSGLTITIGTSGGSANVQYYTVTYKATDAGTASGSVVNGTVTSGTAVLAGTSVTLTAEGHGAIGTGAGYTYLWNDSGSSTDAEIVMTVNSTVNLTCVVTGTDGTFSAKVIINVDNAQSGYFDGKVELRQGATVFNTPDTGGIYTFNVLDGEYDIFVNGVKVGTITVSSTPGDVVIGYYTSMVNVNRDNSIWRDYAGAEVKLDGTITGTFLNGIYTFEPLLPGTYAIYLGSKDIGVALVISDAPAIGFVEFYTVILGASTKGTADSATVTATLEDGTVVVSGDLILKGTEITATAYGSDKDDKNCPFTYQWFDGKTTAVATFTIGNDSRNITCVVTGLGDESIPMFVWVIPIIVIVAALAGLYYAIPLAKRENEEETA